MARNPRPSRRLRFLFCNYEFPPIGGGAGTVSRNLARELVRLGHSVEVVSVHHGKLKRNVRLGRFRLRRLTALRRKPGQSNPIEMISYVLVATPYLMLRGGRRPDVIMSFHSIPSGLVGWILSLVWGIPHIVQFHGGDVPGWLPGVLEAYHRWTLWLNRLVVYQSAAAVACSIGLRDLAQPSFPRKQLGTLVNGVDLDAFAPPRGGREGRSGPVRILFAGRVTVQKGLDVLLEALARPEVRDLKWELDLAGDGPDLPACRAQAAQFGIAGRIRFHGWLDRSAVRPLYDEADLFVLPSRYEGMPMVALEAMGCGLPVVATDIPGTRELFPDGEGAILVPVDDPGALAKALVRLIGDSGKRLAIGRRARELAEECFSWRARALELEQLAAAVVKKG